MRILFDNLINNSTLSPSSENTSFLSANIKNPHLTKIFKFTGNSGEYLDIDLGSVEQIRGIIFDTNLTSTTTANLYANSTNDFTSPAYSTTMDVYEGKVVKFLDETYRYWRVELTDTSLTDIWIKYGFIGDYAQMPPIDPDVDLEYATTSSVSISQTGQTYGDKGFEIFRSDFSFPSITEYTRQIDGQDVATRAEILAMWRLVENITPIYLVIFESSLDIIPPILGVITQNSLTISKSENPGVYETSFSFQETR